ncbi:MAG: hypothetical protein AABZ30_13830 [Myxococcota bacterium]
MTRPIHVLLALGTLFSSAFAGAQKRKARAAGTAAPVVDASQEIPPSKAMEKAVKLYDGGDYYSSSIELHKVIEGETGDAQPTQQKAEFYMGKTLYKLGFYSAALSYFDRIVQAGGAHSYWRATLKWLASLSTKLPQSSGILEKIGKYDRAELEQPELEKVRDELVYLMGRWQYSQGNLKEALSDFQAVPAQSDFYPRAKFFEGLTHVREYRAQDAAGAFKEILRHAIEHPDKPDIADYEALANANLARVFYSTHQWESAIKYYDKLPPESSAWLQGLFESSWAFFQVDEFQKALGNIHSLNAPYFEREFFPESLVLKAVIYWKNCLYDRSEDAINELNATYVPLRKELDGLLEQITDPLEFYEKAQAVREGKSNLPAKVEKLVASLLRDRTVEKQFHYVDELDRELAQVEGADASWKATAVASTILQDLTLQQSLAKNEGGQLARKRIERGRDEIQDLLAQAIKIEIETINAMKGEAEAELRGEQVIAAPGVVQTSVAVDDEHWQWPFQGEYWKDELASYRFKLRSKCK